MSHEVVAHLESVTRSSQTRAVHVSNTIVHVLFVLFAVAVHRYGPRSARGRDAMRLGLTFAALLCASYGLYFGAGHFLSRYLFALSPLYALLWASAVLAVVDELQRRGLRPAGLPFAVAVALGAQAPRDRPLPGRQRDRLPGRLDRHLDLESAPARRRHLSGSGSSCRAGPGCSPAKRSVLVSPHAT